LIDDYFIHSPARLKDEAKGREAMHIIFPLTYAHVVIN
jgi:hypothetical protein